MRLFTRQDEYITHSHCTECGAVMEMARYIHFDSGDFKKEWICDSCIRTRGLEYYEKRAKEEQ